MNIQFNYKCNVNADVGTEDETKRDMIILFGEGMYMANLTASQLIPYWQALELHHVDNVRPGG